VKKNAKRHRVALSPNQKPARHTKSTVAPISMAGSEYQYGGRFQRKSKARSFNCTHLKPKYLFWSEI